MDRDGFTFDNQTSGYPFQSQKSGELLDATLKWSF